MKRALRAASVALFAAGLLAVEVAMVLGVLQDARHVTAAGATAIFGTIVLFDGLLVGAMSDFVKDDR